jgi:predicted peroxiredoxin
MSESGFAGLRVLSLESRRSQEMEKLISNFGGRPLMAPSMREVPLEANTAVFDFASALIEGNIDVVIFLTGVGARVLTRMVETKYSKEEFVTALSSVPVVARALSRWLCFAKWAFPSLSEFLSPTHGARCYTRLTRIRQLCRSRDAESLCRSMAFLIPDSLEGLPNAARQSLRSQFISGHFLTI